MLSNNNGVYGIRDEIYKDQGFAIPKDIIETFGAYEVVKRDKQRGRGEVYLRNVLVKNAEGRGPDDGRQRSEKYK